MEGLSSSTVQLGGLSLSIYQYCVVLFVGGSLNFLVAASIGVRANFFYGGLSHLCGKIFSTAHEKTATLTCKNYFARLTPPSSLISKNPGFWAHYLAGQYEFRFFR